MICLSTRAKRKDLVKRSKKAAVYKPEIEPSPGSKLAGVLFLGSSASRTVSNKFLLFKPPSLWYFAVITQKD